MPIAEPLEEFVLAAIEAGLEGGVEFTLRTAGALRTMEENGGSGLKFAVALPGYLALRILLVSGAFAYHCENYRILGRLLNEPIEVQLLGGQFEYQPIWKMRGLFFSEAFLGFADLTILHVSKAFQSGPHLSKYFQDEASFLRALSSFVLLISLRNVSADSASELGIYPGYKIIPGANEAIQRFVGRLANRPETLSAVASLFGEDTASFRSAWQGRVDRVNSGGVGSGYWPFGVSLPRELL